METTTTSFCVPYDVLDLPLNPTMRRDFYATDVWGQNKIQPRAVEIEPQADLGKPTETRLSDKKLLQYIQNLGQAPGGVESALPTDIEKNVIPNDLNWRKI